MPHNDTNSIMCRAAGNIYLPKKMTYSEYIKDALLKTLRTVQKSADSANQGHTMDVVLTDVNFDTIGGKWMINADVHVNEKKITSVETTTEYGTSFIAAEACRNTAESFDEAVKHFIQNVLTHPSIISNLK